MMLNINRLIKNVISLLLLVVLTFSIPLNVAAATPTHSKKYYANKLDDIYGENFPGAFYGSYGEKKLNKLNKKIKNLMKTIIKEYPDCVYVRYTYNLCLYGYNNVTYNFYEEFGPMLNDLEYSKESYEYSLPSIFYTIDELEGIDTSDYSSEYDNGSCLYFKKKYNLDLVEHEGNSYTYKKDGESGVIIKRAVREKIKCIIPKGKKYVKVKAPKDYSITVMVNNNSYTARGNGKYKKIKIYKKLKRNKKIMIYAFSPDRSKGDSYFKKIK